MSLVVRYVLGRFRGGPQVAEDAGGAGGLPSCSLALAAYRKHE